ncbi:MAG: hypothetical protein ACXW03_04285 [Methylobacter sp.]
MYSGNFICIEDAEEDTGISVSELIKMGRRGKLSIYAWNDNWLWSKPFEPQFRWGLNTPALIDDIKLLISLSRGKSVNFDGNTDMPVIYNRGDIEDNFLDGVEVSQKDLFCLKSEIEELKRKNSIVKPNTEAVKVVYTVNQSGDGGIESKKPWEIHNPDDPPPTQPWYTPARFFARELVKEDSTLLLKKDSLAAKVVKSLSNVGIKKRGGKLPLDPATVKKAFSNISFG